MFKLYEKILNEGKFDVLSKKYPLLNIEQIFKEDPSPTKKYSEWMCKQLMQGFKEQDLVASIQIFYKIGRNLEKKDINQYKDLSELENAIKDLSFSKTQKRKVVKSEGTKKIYEDDTSLVLRIDTKEACVFYGSNTRWCITMTDDQYYNEYVSSGTFFYFILSKVKREDYQNKVAVAIEVDEENKPIKVEFFDEEDSNISISDLEIPNIKEIVNTYIKNDLKTAPQHFLYRLENGKFSIEEYRKYVSGLKNQELHNAKLSAANNPNAPEELLIEFSEDSDIQIRQVVASNRNLPLDAIYKLLDQKNIDILSSLCINPRTPLEILKKIFIMEDNGYDSETNIDTNLAANTSIDEELFYKIYEKYKDFSRKSLMVFNSLVFNKKVPEKIFVEIINNILTKMKKNEEFYHYEKYIYDDIIYNAFRNPVLPLEMIKKYSKSSTERTDIKDDEQLLNHNFELKIQEAIIENPKTPIRILKNLVYSDNMKIHNMASRQLEKRMNSQQKENKLYSLKHVLLEKRDITLDTEKAMMDYKAILRKKRFLCKVSLTEPDFSLKHGDFGFLEVLIDLKSGRGKNMTKYSILKYCQRLAEKSNLIKYFNYSGYSLNGQYLEIQFELKEKYINLYKDKYQQNQEEQEGTASDSWYLPKNK